MSMPLHLVLVRHGESEANIVNRAMKHGRDLVTPEFLERADGRIRLSPKGVEQAKTAGAWITRFVLDVYPELNEGFDLQYISPLARCVETAGNLALRIKSAKAAWRIEQRLRERYYGDLRGVSRAEHGRRYPENATTRRIDPLYWQPPGGESIAQVSEGRFRSMLGTLADQHGSHNVNSAIMVAHGEYLWAARLCLLRMSNEDWAAAEDDPSQKIKNTQVDHYTRVNPVTGDIAPAYMWMRSVCPWENPEDPGEWREIPLKRYTNEELLDIAASIPPLDIPGGHAT